ncbi:ABC transporter permease [Mesorhizobium sp. CO1-1-8]|uniref:ABC transporter permease n=1 Tax=Mesorhizobium sp. CO1-1-8 TaxID=2876631 RepID=UPI001CD056D7|nr:ABC transporter permease [Mesorhizobium sp. CO1-1-8]MBZ9772201.1 ABC transporter permease [Mesorhizobium sp. CO1-1-8]
MAAHLTIAVDTKDSARIARDPDPPGSRQDDLGRHLRRQERIREFKALCLTAPALVFLFVAFIGPLLFFMYRAVDNSDLVDNIPRTTQAMNVWSGAEAMPPDAVQQALVDDLTALRGTPALAILARTLNYHQAGYRSLVQKTANGLAAHPEGTAAQRLATIDERWAEPVIWQILRQESSRWTPLFVLSAIDLQRKPDGSIGRVDEDTAIYQRVFLRTFLASIGVTAACVVLGYVTAYSLVRIRPRLGRAALFIVLISLWTSLLVRTLAWILILQKNGVLNAALTGSGIVDEPLQFIRTWFAVGLAMVHLLLPLMILPIASVMQSIPPSYVRASRSLGASPWRAFWSVYLPLTFPGIGAGIVLVSTLSLGFFITPELLGGPEHQMVSYFVAFFTNMSVNWGLASALGAWLFIMTIALFAVIYRVFGITRVAA